MVENKWLDENGASKFLIKLPALLRNKIKVIAAQHKVSMNEKILTYIELGVNNDIKDVKKWIENPID